MFSKQTLFIIAGFAVANGAQIQPFDLVEQVTEQLEELKAIVKSEITSAQNSLQSLFSQFGRLSAVTASNAITSLQQQHSEFLAQLQSIKDFVYAYGKDPSSCTAGPEQLFSDLVPRYSQRIIECVAELNVRAKKLTESSSYIVDISYSTVTHFEHQVSQCEGSLLCILPILTEIELNKIKLPQSIKTEVQAADTTITTLRLSVQSCPGDNLAHYTTMINVFIENIEECVNRLIG